MLHRRMVDLMAAFPDPSAAENGFLSWLRQEQPQLLLKTIASK